MNEEVVPTEKDMEVVTPEATPETPAPEVPAEEPAAPPEPPIEEAEQYQGVAPSGILIKKIAQACHEANRIYCERVNDMSIAPWASAPNWQKETQLKGVIFAVANPDATAEQMHERWAAVKIADGWKYGSTKNAETKEHPCLLPYAALGREQQYKDLLFKAIVNALM